MRVPLLLFALGVGGIARAGDAHSSGGHSTGGGLASSGVFSSGHTFSSSGSHSSTQWSGDVGLASDGVMSVHGVFANAAITTAAGGRTVGNVGVSLPGEHGFPFFPVSVGEPTVGSSASLRPVIPQMLSSDYFSGTTAYTQSMVGRAGSGGGFFPLDSSVSGTATEANELLGDEGAAWVRDDDDDIVGCERGFPVRVWPTDADAEGLCLDPRLRPHPSIGVGAADWFNYDPGAFPCRHWKTYQVDARLEVKLILARKTPDAPESEVKVLEPSAYGKGWMEKQSYVLPPGSWEPAETREYRPHAAEMKVEVPEAEYVHLKVCQRAPANGLFDLR
jgi:hypothetical protein